MTDSISFAPFIPWQGLAALAVVAAVLLGLAAWRGLHGWFLRALGLCLLLVALANPFLRKEQRNPLPDVAFLVLDNTASQTLPERSEQLAAARERIARLFADQGARAPELIVRHVRNTPGDGEQSGTLLIKALTQAAADVSPDRIAGAILVSDGRIHDTALPDNFPAPVHLLQTGLPGDKDRRIVLENAPAYGIVGGNITVTFRIEDTNMGSGSGMANVYFTHDDGITRIRRLPLDTTVSLDLPVTHAGKNLVEIRVDKLFGELTDKNNAALFSFDGIRDRLRVLLVSGEPYAGERTWRNLLKSDAAVDLVHFTVLRAPDKQDGVPVSELSLIAFPTRELFMDKIDDFDLIVFDRYRRQGILPNIYLQNITRYVEQGGALLVTTGGDFAGVESLARSPLGGVLPASPTGHVFTQGYLPRVSPLGQRHPVTEGLGNQPTDATAKPDWGRWFRQVELEQTSGNVVMEGVNGKPLLVLDRVGQGRVALLASDQAWLWSRGVEGGGPQAELLRRLAHWLMKEPELEEEVLSARATGHQVTVTRHTLSQHPADVEIVSPEDTALTAPLERITEGVWQTGFNAPENGLYRIGDGTLKTLVAVGPAAGREFEQPVGASPELLDFIKETGGGVFPLFKETPDIRRTRFGQVAAGDGWLGLPRRDAYTVQDIRHVPLAPDWLMVLLIGLLAIAAWRTEGR